MKSKSEKRSPLKEKPLRYAGQSLGEQIEDKALNLAFSWIGLPVLITLLTIDDWIRYLNPQPSPKPIAGTVVAITLLIIGVFKVIKGKREIDRLKMGRDGEKLVAEGLQEMIRQGAAVLHDIQGDKFNIDHVVVSKHGIFLIETKTYSKPINKETTITSDNENVYVDGMAIERNPINQVKALTGWLQNLLKESTGKSFKIRPVILFPGWYTDKTKSGADIWIH